MVKVIFLYMSNGNATPGSYPADWKPTHPCGPHYEQAYGTEGYFTLLKKLLDVGVIDDLKVFFESNVRPGIANFVKHPKAYSAVIPEIRQSAWAIEKDSIIFVRGGFRHWHNFLTPYKDKNWLMLYGANTGRERWTWWDVILDDLHMKNKVDRYGRYWFPFIKPIDPNIFRPQYIEPKFDLCMGASRVHDKKGQWRTFSLIPEIEKRLGRPIKALLPGSRRNGVQSNKMYSALDSGQFDVLQIGHAHRSRLADYINQSKVFVHLGTSGQNDRGPLEALSCGIPTIIGSPEYHTPKLRVVDGCYVFENMKDMEAIVERICNLIEDPEFSKNEIVDSFQKHLGFQESVFQMAKLFNYMVTFPPTEKTKNLMPAIFEVLTAYENPTKSKEIGY